MIVLLFGSDSGGSGSGGKGCGKCVALMNGDYDDDECGDGGDDCDNYDECFDDYDNEECGGGGGDVCGDDGDKGNDCEDGSNSNHNDNDMNCIM